VVKDLPPLFDLDNTLLDTRLLALEAYQRALFEVVGLRLDQVSLVEANPGVPAVDFLTKVLSRRGIAPDAVLVERTRAAFRRWLHDEELLWSTLRLVPGIEVLVRDLRAAGWPLVIITQKPQSIAEVHMARVDLQPDILISTEGRSEVGALPKVSGLLQALDELGGRHAPSSYLYVGDAPADCRAAKAAGLRAAAACWCTWAGALPQGCPERELLHLRQVAALVIERPDRLFTSPEEVFGD